MGLVFWNQFLEDMFNVYKSFLYSYSSYPAIDFTIKNLLPLGRA